MSNKNLIAVLIAMAMGIWLFSGSITSNVVTADEGFNGADANKIERKIPFVRAIKSKANIQLQFLDVSGQTRANRVVEVKAEVSGRVEQVVAEKGTHVQAGDVLCKIAIDTRQSEFEKAKANLQSAQIEYDGILDLKRRSLQSEINVARAKAALESSRADADRAQLALQKTNIIAPFAAVVDTQPVEIGDYLNVGQICVTLMEIDPILVVGQISERRINGVVMGGEVEVELITGEKLSGVVSFIGRAPDAATRTYPVEVTIHKPGANIRSGLTARMRVPQGEQAAHLISLGFLLLNDNGEIGVRIVDDVNIVHFMPVVILNEGTNGTWVTGLPDEINLITVGQEEVFEGQLVKVDYSALGSLVSN